MTTLAIDPGNQLSAYCVVDGQCLPLVFEKLSNDQLIRLMQKEIDGEYGVGRVVIEMVASYGMAVGADVFETCVWIGRFAQVAHAVGVPVELIKRIPVKVHHCYSSRATDGAIAQALVDRFAPGEPNHGKGTKKAPGFFYGFSGDIWQAMALAVYAIDTAEERS
jgi:hypothetical protein